MGLIPESTTIQSNIILTITLDNVNLFSSSSSIADSLRNSMVEDVEILKISGPITGTRYAITFRTKIKAKALYFIDAFLWAFHDLDYPRAVFVQLESGEESTGLSSLLGDIESSLTTIGSDAVSSTLKSLFPYLLSTLIVYMIINSWIKGKDK